MKEINTKKALIGLAICLCAGALAFVLGQVPVIANFLATPAAQQNASSPTSVRALPGEKVGTSRAKKAPAAASAKNTAAAVTGVSVIAASSSLLAPAPARIVVSAIMAGKKGEAAYEYVELYNPSAAAADLSGYSIKKRSATGTESTLVAAARFKGKIIPAGKHFLLANAGGYSGAVVADIVWPPSYVFARTKNAVTLYDKAGDAVDTVSWHFIPEGKSVSRVSLDTDSLTITDPVPRNSSN